MAAKKRMPPGGVETLDVPSAEIQASLKSFVYGASVGIRTRDKRGVIQTVKRGLLISAFDRLQAELDIPAKRLAITAGIAERTLARRRKEGRLSPAESGRLLRIGVLFDKALDVLGDKGLARRWFRTPKKALGGQSPLEYADTEIGAREVEDLLGRIEHGVFS